MSSGRPAAVVHLLRVPEDLVAQHLSHRQIVVGDVPMLVLPGPFRVDFRHFPSGQHLGRQGHTQLETTTGLEYLLRRGEKG